MDDLEQVKQKISIVEYVKQHTSSQIKNLGNGQYRVNPCPICNHKDHFTLYADTNSYSSFNNCCEGGDILNYMQEVEGLSFQDATDKLYSITNTPREKFNPRQAQEKQQKKPQPKPTEKKPTKEELQKINDFINKEQAIFLQNQDAQAELIGYLATRYIGEEAIYKYRLFLREDAQGQQRVYIPIYEQGQPVAYIGRAIDSQAQLRYKNSQGTIQPFNIDYLSKEAEQEDEPLFICEGVFDAISIEEQGKKAIALNSTQNVDKFLDALKEHKDTASKYKFIIATDNDEARTKGTRKTSNRTYKAKHSKQLFEDTNLLQGRKRVVL